MSDESLRHHLLDLLVDGPSSYAALHVGLIRNCGYPADLQVDRVLDVLRDMENRGWIRVRQMSDDGGFHDPTEDERQKARTAYQGWLARAGPKRDVALDEIGLWFEIDFNGREEWARWSADCRIEDRAKWVLDDDSSGLTVTIEAKNSDIAEQVLRDWCSRDPEIHLLNGSISIGPLPMFVTRDGTVVYDAVRLRCRYRREG